MRDTNILRQQSRISQTTNRGARSTKSVVSAQEELIENLVVIPPDGGWGWFVVVMSFISNFVIDGVMYTFGLFLEEISESLNVPTTKVALANSLMNGFNLVIGPLTCAIANRYGFRLTGMVGGVISATSFLVTTFFLNLNALLILMGFVCGSGFNMIFISSNLVVGFYFEKWRALATAISLCGSSMGVVAFPPMVTTLMKNLHWTWKFRILSGLTLLTSVCAISYKPIKPVKVMEQEKKYSTYSADPEESVYSFAIEKPQQGTRSIFKSYHNTRFPTTGEYYDAASSVYTRKMYEDSRASDPSIARSMFLNKTDNVSYSLSTVHEWDGNQNDGKKSKCIKCKNCLKRYCCRCCNKATSESSIPNLEKFNRPMYRDDIFYAGSIYVLPEFSKAQENIGTSVKKSTVSYHLSVSRVATQRDLAQNQQCVCCPEAVVRTLATMLHLKLLKSPTFVVLTISGFFSLMSLYIPFLFVVARAMEMGIDKKNASFLLTIIGISNTLGRITCGILSWFPKIDVIIVTYVSVMVAGVSIIVSNYLDQLSGQITCAFFFGYSIATITVLRSLIIVDLLGLENLTNAFGITVLFFGVGTFIGTPVGGILREYTGKYDECFLFSGCTMILSGLLIIPLRKINKWEIDKNQPRKVTFRE